MSKIGKKFTLSSDQTFINKFYNLIIGKIDRRIKITDYKETYNETNNNYEGYITLTGRSNDDIERFKTSNADFLKQLNERNSSVVFDIDTHYQVNRADFSGNADLKSMSDFLNIYKFTNFFEYNFLVKNYENYLNNQNRIQETGLPYFYDVLNNFINSNNISYQKFDGTSFFESPESVITQSFRPELKTNVVSAKYTVNNKELTIDKYLEKFNVYKEQFPFYADMAFDTHQLDKKSIAGALLNKNLLTPLFNTIVTASGDSQLNWRVSGLSNQQITGNVNVKELDIDSFLTNQLDFFVNESDFTFIFDVNQRVDNKARDFLEVLQGKPEYSEVIGYHLKKYENESNTLLQEWYLPNVSEGQLEVIDSQIKYDKKYTYKLDLIVLTFATEYQFTKVSTKANNLTLQFVNTPLIKTYVLQNIVGTSNTTLGATYTNKLLDYPPLEPEIEIIPFIGVDNKVKINLNTSTGLKTVPAINFSPEEEARKAELRLAQDKRATSSLLTFQTDEPAEYFEIYRIEKKPKSYADFFDSSIQNINTNNSSAGSFVDNILPNKKYYYIARCKDFHGNISNPTPVYELEIINDNGLIIPVINFVDFDKSENQKQESKEFNRYIKIQPAARHRITNIEQTNADNIKLGSDLEAPWGKKFKMRLTSKSTGKKIDVNFTFNYNKST